MVFEVLCYYSSMPKDIIKQGESVFGDYLKRAYHMDQPNSVADPEYTKVLINEFEDLNKSIQQIKTPKSRKDVLTNELKRISKYYVTTLSEELDPRTATPKEVIDRYFIKDEDIDFLKTWLKENREKVLEANKRQLEFYSDSRRSRVHLGSKALRDQAESLMERHLDLLKRAVKEVLLLDEYNHVLGSFVISTDSVVSRSYADKIARISMVGTGACVYMVDGKMFIDSVELIGKFGHEVLGHCLNFVFTEKSDLPLFIKEDYFAVTSASRESVSGYFKNRLFDLLLTKPDSIKDFEMDEPFERIFQRYKDTFLLDEYSLRLNMLGFWVMSNSTMNGYNDQMKDLAEYSIEPKWVSFFLNRHRNDWNRSTGLLLPNIVSELRYAVESVTKILNKKKPSDIKKFERAILTGAWSPDGFEEWVSLPACVE